MRTGFAALPIAITGVLLALGLAAASASSTAAAATVWRCGPDGRTFSDRPCADTGTEVALRDATPTADEVAAARALARREARFGDQLASERLRRERVEAGRGLAGIAHAAAARDLKPRLAQKVQKRTNKPKAPKTLKAGTPNAAKPRSDA